MAAYRGERCLQARGCHYITECAVCAARHVLVLRSPSGVQKRLLPHVVPGTNPIQLFWSRSPWALASLHLPDAAETDPTRPRPSSYIRSFGNLGWNSALLTPIPPTSNPRSSTLRMRRETTAKNKIRKCLKVTPHPPRQTLPLLGLRKRQKPRMGAEDSWTLPGKAPCTCCSAHATSFDLHQWCHAKQSSSPI